VLELWTRAVLRLRLIVLACWLLVLVAGALSAARLPALLSNSLAVPGTDSEAAQTILARRFHERPDGTFTVVFAVREPSERALGALQRRLQDAARAVPGGHAMALRKGEGIVYGEVATALDLQQAKGWTVALRRALRKPGFPVSYVTGEPAIQHDLDPILSVDLHRGETIALPIALLVLVAVLGISAAVLIPFVFAACTITTTLAALYLIAHALPISSYAPNLVELIGLGLAVDYSLLVVHRFREELARGAPPTPASISGPTPSFERVGVDEAVVRTMQTAGRAIVFSGMAVAIGLAVVLIMPVPFMRSLGIAGFLVPLVSIAATLTLQPVLLSLFGRRGMRAVRVRALRPARAPESDLWARLAGAIMRRPAVVLLAGVAVLLAAAAPVVFLRLTPGSISAIPRSTESARGLALLRERVGAGAVTPIEVVVDAGVAGGARTAAVRAATERLVQGILQDEEAYITATCETAPCETAPYVDASGRYRRVFVVGRHEYGDQAMQSLVRRLRSHLVPAARFPAAARVYVGGAPAQGVDFLARVYGMFPWIVLAVLALTYVVLLRAFRSLLLPLKAVLLNVLTVLASYGLLVVIFRFGAGAELLGLYRIEQVEGWIPVFLFAMLFGLSMDYEVFLVTRMRESWDEHHDNQRAVVEGLRRTGRIITAAAAIMVVAFSGFVAGRVAGLQEFGAGLALAVLLDATIVRMLLVPSLMAVLGSWNWWLPKPIARLARIRSSADAERA
jgi:RND superfamily putative drug exporter